VLFELHGNRKNVELNKTMSNLKLVYELPGNLGKAYKDNVTPSEHADVMIVPAAGQALVVLNNRVLIIKAGIGGGVWALGARCKSFSYEDISSIDLQVSTYGGHLQITGAGIVESQQGMAVSENAVVFQKEYKEEMKAACALIRERVEMARRNKSLAVPSTPDLASQVQKLAELHSAGALTDEEFSAAKQKLLM